MKRLFTSESVTEGHPDKICDQISDAIVDAILKEDPQGRVAAETTVNTGYAMIMGEITTECYVDIPKIARQVIVDIGYDRAKYGFDGYSCAIMTSIDEQSPDIALGVNESTNAIDTVLLNIMKNNGLMNGLSFNISILPRRIGSQRYSSLVVFSPITLWNRNQERMGSLIIFRLYTIDEELSMRTDATHKYGSRYQES